MTYVIIWLEYFIRNKSYVEKAIKYYTYDILELIVYRYIYFSGIVLIMGLFDKTQKMSK